ncbi:MAG TPA: SH3 domain-containing protein [Candidatus Limnocylindrales bacterium]|nr:SH3 domain-containing protein [Candidatus Limnocylindrales bacterium]
MGYRAGGYRRGGGPPGWLIILIAVALVFGGFYLLQGAQNFIRTGGQGVEEATSRAQVIGTATAERVTRMATVAPELRPSATPQPECQDFRVIGQPNGVVREQPSSSAPVITGLSPGTIVCVLGRAGDPEWYVIDLNRETRRLDEAYMNEVVIEAVNPTPTGLPTVTPMPTFTPSVTPEASATLPATATRTSVPSRTATVRPSATVRTTAAP